MSLIFNIEGVEQRFKEHTEAECSKSGIDTCAGVSYRPCTYIC